MCCVDPIAVRRHPAARLALLSLALLVVFATPALAGEPTDRLEARRLVHALDRPGQRLHEAVCFKSRERVRTQSGGECWHFRGQSTVTGENVVGVEQRWELPAACRATPRQVMDLVWAGATVGKDGEGPRFSLERLLCPTGWRPVQQSDSIFGASFGGALVKVDNVRPVQLSGLYQRMGGTLLLDRDRVLLDGAGERAEFQLLALNPTGKRSAFPSSQYASMRVGARRNERGRLEVYKEYLALEPTEWIAAGAPVLKPVSAAMSLWRSTPTWFRKLTPMGIGTELGARLTATVMDAALGPQLERLVLERHSRLFDETFFPNLKAAIEALGR